MKVAQRIITKLILLVLVIAGAAAGAIGYRGYQQSTAEYAMNQYLTCLLNNQVDQAYAMTDSADDLTKEEYKKAIDAGGYSLYSSCDVENGEKQADSNGEETQTFHVKFLNAGKEVKMEKDFTAIKQKQLRFGVFEQWKIDAQHCMITDFSITVPVGAKVFLDAQEADASWILQEEKETASVCYVIPRLIPGNVQVTVRHPVFETISLTVDPSQEAVDLTTKMTWKEAAKDAAKEAGVEIVKKLTASAVGVTENEEWKIPLECTKEAEAYVKKQKEIFDAMEQFKSAAFSLFAAKYEEPVFSESEQAVEMKMDFSYHSCIKQEKEVETGNYAEDGSMIYETQTTQQSGNQTAHFTLTWKDGAFCITQLEIPVLE